MPGILGPVADETPRGERPRAGSRAPRAAAWAGPLLLALLVFLLGAPALSPGKTWYSADGPLAFQPWKGALQPKGRHPRNPDLGDQDFLYYPFLRFMGRELKERGALPLWNPHLYGGVPLAGNAQFPLLYPVHGLLWLSQAGKKGFDPAAFDKAFTWHALLRLLLCALGGWFWLRRLWGPGPPEPPQPEPPAQGAKEQSQEGVPGEGLVEGGRVEAFLSRLGEPEEAVDRVEEGELGVSRQGHAAVEVGIPKGEGTPLLQLPPHEPEEGVVEEVLVAQIGIAGVAALGLEGPLPGLEGQGAVGGIPGLPRGEGGRPQEEDQEGEQEGTGPGRRPRGPGAGPGPLPSWSLVRHGPQDAGQGGRCQP